MAAFKSEKSWNTSVKESNTNNASDMLENALQQFDDLIEGNIVNCAIK